MEKTTSEEYTNPIQQNTPRSLITSKIIRFATFCSGGAFPILIINAKNFSEFMLSILVPCISIFCWKMPIYCAKHLNRSTIVWRGLAIITAGISNCILSVQSVKEN
ncbi:hypothetical protein [Candidatus Uabimicrobium sp. HlEnr_7]|uniref:hypothetical protein n=1 Tax=Candidatus Uabimicrobium helgolandensis TaxID=3095367 RepID=UPI0035574123